MALAPGVDLGQLAQDNAISAGRHTTDKLCVRGDMLQHRLQLRLAAFGV